MLEREAVLLETAARIALCANQPVAVVTVTCYNAADFAALRKSLWKGALRTETAKNEGLAPLQNEVL